jgi:hypothetical protein
VRDAKVERLICDGSEEEEIRYERSLGFIETLVWE